MHKNTCLNQRSANQQGGIWTLKLQIRRVYYGLSASNQLRQGDLSLDLYFWALTKAAFLWLYWTWICQPISQRYVGRRLQWIINRTKNSLQCLLLSKGVWGNLGSPYIGKLTPVALSCEVKLRLGIFTAFWTYRTCLWSKQLITETGHPSYLLI